MRKLTLVLLLALLLIVAYLTHPQPPEWIRWDGWSLFF